MMGSFFFLSPRVSHSRGRHKVAATSEHKFGRASCLFRIIISLLFRELLKVAYNRKKKSITINYYIKTTNKGPKYKHAPKPLNVW